MDEIAAVASRHGIAILEDAAEAIGSEYKGRKAGSFGDASVFSFHGSKTLTTGEGGMLVTNDAKLFERAQFLRDHGRKPGDKMFFNHEVAYKYKMTSMQAALGLAQLERIEELLEHKRKTFKWYQEELNGVDGVRLNCGAPDTRPVYWMVTVMLDPKFNLPKERLMEKMSERKIDCRPFFHPLSSIPAYRDTEQARQARTRNQVSYRLAPYGLNLPSSLSMTREKVEIVCSALKEILLEHAPGPPARQQDIEQASSG
jgi:perosamine synthetase